MKISDLFYIYNGNKLDFQNMDVDNTSDINFISRKTTNNGVVCKVKEKDGITPYKAGAITVTLGGSYLLTAYVQAKNFYTAQNIKVLVPKTQMRLEKKLFYCYAISLNRFKYQAFGREANKTFDTIELPDEIPDWVNTKTIKFKGTITNTKKEIANINTSMFKYYDLRDYFDMYAGKYYSKESYETGDTPLISASETNNGVQEFVSLEPTFEGNALTIGKIGISTFYQKEPFVATSDVTVLIPKFETFNSKVAIFLKTIIELEKYKWSYGRQIRLGDCQKLRVKLPEKGGEPDWEYMENVVNGFTYSEKI